MNARFQTRERAESTPTPSSTTTRSGLVLREGGYAYPRDERRSAQQPLQRRDTDHAEPSTAPVRQDGRSAAGHNFSQVAVHAATPGTVQTKLAFSQPGDAFEREADRVAEQVMRTPRTSSPEGRATAGRPPDISRRAGQGHTKHVARQPAEDEETLVSPEDEIDEADLLSLKEVPGTSHEMSTGLATQIQSLRGGGQPLASDLRAFFEPRFSYDFSQVRVHTDARAAQTARELNARAYTLGRDVAFAPGEYRPQTPEGRTLLAHELTHVVQQGDRAQTVMRACDCRAAGGRDPTPGEDSRLRSAFPHLVSGEYCVTAPATPTYNCFAWSIGNTSRWVQSEVDSVHGNNNGTLEFSDFDSFYRSVGLEPVIAATPMDAEVALFAKGNTPTHAARKSTNPCSGFESKLGRSVRIVHEVRQLEGGSVYGDVDRFYVPS
jgi:Domain of unknown function (DUF4157)